MTKTSSVDSRDPRCSCHVFSKHPDSYLSHTFSQSGSSHRIKARINNSIQCGTNASVYSVNAFHSHVGKTFN